jgi:putative flippase GtrA
MAHLIDKLPAALASRLRTRFGWHFSRFALVAIASLGVTQATLAILYLAGVTPGLATLVGWMAGALTSYLLSRWAWQRKGRPSVVRETLPFWAISLATAAVLTTTGHFAGTYAKAHYQPGLERVVAVNAAVLAANVITFLARFLIFHYVLFADRAPGDRPDSASAVGAAAHAGPEHGGHYGVSHAASVQPAAQPGAERLDPVASSVWRAGQSPRRG